MLCALDFYHDTVAQVVIVGDPAVAAAQALLRAAHRGYRPNKVVIAGRPDSTAPPLLTGRMLVDARPTAYVCHDRTCRQPVTTPEDLTAELSAR